MEKQCGVCQRRAVETLVTHEGGRVVQVKFFCAEHWIEHEGEEGLRQDLEVARDWPDYEAFHPEVALEVRRQYPKRAQEFEATLREITRRREEGAGFQRTDDHPERQP